MAIISEKASVCDARKSIPAGVDAFFRQVDADKFVAERDQEFCPSTESWRYFQYARRRQEAVQSRIDGTNPMRLAATPGGAPLFTGLTPIVVSFPGTFVPIQIRHHELRELARAGRNTKGDSEKRDSEQALAGWRSALGRKATKAARGQSRQAKFW